MLLAHRVAACLFPVASFAVAAEDLTAVLARVVKAGAAFKSMSARLTNTDHTEVLKEDFTKTGTIRMLRPKQGELLFLTEFTQPDLSSVSFHDKTIEIYLPKIATVQVYKLGKYSRLVEQFLLLGFGSSSRALKSTYNITLIGPESIDGAPTSHLELVPKDKEAVQQVPRIGLWIGAQGYPVRHQIFEPSGNYRMFSYSDLRINPSLNLADVKLNLPANVKREYPGQ